MMKDTLQRSTQYFKTYEEREEAFRKGVFSLIPRKYSGPKLFWKDFSKISFEEVLSLIKQPVAYITSNPRDCLVYGTPWQVLTAARLYACKAVKRSVLSADQAAKAFDVYETLHQPIRTLSGGETVKLALAKSYLYSAYSRRLTIASPFSWLSRDNVPYFDRLFQHYVDLGIPVELLALEGEDSNEPIMCKDVFCQETKKPVDFHVFLKNIKILLGSSLNPIYSPDAYAVVDDLEADLLSPCIIVGENGQGKSLVAKVLAGAISFQGDAKIRREDKCGPARLLFQDVITQTLLRSFETIAASPYAGSRANTLAIFEKILKQYFLYLDNSTDKPTDIGSAGGADFRSLLEIKAILVAARLCGQPCALILDEPDWGLNRASAIAFVLSIINVSHKLGSPVFLISHKPWWINIAKSTIRVKRTAKKIDKAQNYSFQIQVSHGVT